MKLLPGPLRRRNGDEKADDGKPNGKAGGAKGLLTEHPDKDELEKRRKQEQRERLKEQALEVPIATLGWVDERTGAGPFLRGFLYRKVPKGTNWFYTLGSATMFAFVSQAVTGVFLAMYYRPSVNEAYGSIQHINNDVFLGQFVHGMHKWGSSI
ncbi:MAG: menaquinol-cytochrome c reductase cytochrome b subunit, partial [Thermoleophilaceae bacterium]|nr:menaquinol-cytochrome c reductase cytochrome b subunit [Thermoleophilaceae bacterium]